MHVGRTVFSQLMNLFPVVEFRRCVERHRGNHKVQRFSCLDQFLCLAFAQLTSRESENGGAKLDHRAANRSCFWAE